MSNILKRKNEDDTEVSENEQLNKRVALDSEQLEEAETQDTSDKSAPQSDSDSNPASTQDTESENNKALKSEISETGKSNAIVDDSSNASENQSSEDSHPSNASNASNASNDLLSNLSNLSKLPNFSKFSNTARGSNTSITSDTSDTSNIPNISNISNIPDILNGRNSRNASNASSSLANFSNPTPSTLDTGAIPGLVPGPTPGSNYEHYPPTSAPGYGSQHEAKPVQNYREKEDANNVSVRMLVSVKEAGIIVGKKGEKITHIREKANVRIFVSENLKNVPERVVSVRGSAENVARAFGLLARTILDEPEDEPASMMSRQYILKLLVPHAIIGYIIGKQGSKFREIEENSAAKLKAAEHPLPFSTDRILTVLGVGDAIHIALYYICQVLIEHRDSLKKNKVVFYNPTNFQQQQPQQPHQPPMGGNPMMGGPPLNGGMPYMAAGPMHVQGVPGIPQMDNMGPQQSYNLPQHQKPYEYPMMYQPSVRPHYSGPSNLPQGSMPQGSMPQGSMPQGSISQGSISQGSMPPGSMPPGSIPPQSSYTDEHGNTIIGDVITNPPVQISSNPDRFTQDVFVANSSIGSVIGKGGHNIKQIRESSGCAYVKIEPDQHQSILLGGGRGLTSIRKLTLTGTFPSIQNAIYLINQRIGQDKERNGIQ